MNLFELLNKTEPMNIVDLADSPYKDSMAKNGFGAVNNGLITIKSSYPGTNSTPHCHIHRAMNKVDSSGLWRCLMCNIGCFQT